MYRNVFRKSKPFIILFLLQITLTITGCGKKTEDISDFSQQEKMISSYLENLNKGDVDKALENVYFTDEDITSGYIYRLKDTLSSEFHYKTYKIVSVESINDHINIANVILHTNNNSQDKSIYVDEEFNPYLCLIDEKMYIVYTKERIPESLYSDSTQIPDNY